MSTQYSPETEAKIKDCMESGIAHQQSGDYQQAITAYTEAIELGLENAAVYSNRGKAYSDSDQLESAIPDLNKAIELDPGCIEAYNIRGGAYRRIGNLDRAIQDFNRAVELDPGHATSFYNRGIVCFESSDTEQAIKDFTKAVELNPNLAQAYNNRGLAYRHLGQLELAIRDYDRTIEIAPDFAMAYNNRGFAYAGSGDLEQAIQNFNRAIELGLDHATVYRNRGRAYLESGDLSQAIQDLHKAIELGPYDPQAYLIRGHAFSFSNNPEQAIPDLQRYLELEPDAPDREHVIKLIERLKMAYADLLAAAKRDPDSVDFTHLRLAYAKSPEYDPYDAKKDVILAVREVSQAFERADMESTIKAGHTVLELNYLHLNTHMKMSLAYTRAGDEEKAAHHQKFARNWIMSILQSGDGRSFQTAYTVISLDEEYAVLPVLGAEKTLQRLAEHESHAFDVFEVRDVKTGEPGEIYFNIDIIAKGIREGRAEQPSRDQAGQLRQAIEDRATSQSRRRTPKKKWQFWK